MKNKTQLLTLCGALLCALSACQTPENRPQTPLLSQQSDFVNLIRLKNVPETARYYDASAFSDLGAWAGYALPVNESNEHQGAFIGPMNMRGRGWIAQSMANPVVHVDGKAYDLKRNIQTAKYLPGKLIQEFNDEQLHIVTELCFVNNRSAVVRTRIQNRSDKALQLSLDWNGGTFAETAKLSLDNRCVSAVRLSDQTFTATDFPQAADVKLVKKDSLYVTEVKNHTLAPAATYQTYYTQTLGYSEDEVKREHQALKGLDVDACFAQNEARWNQQLASLLNQTDNKYTRDNKYRKVIVKAMMTLNSNWRSAAGDLLHAGSYPSYNGFFGFWSWDSWKIASANALYNPEMAKDEMRTLFDYQAENGMVPDYVSYYKQRNNWRDSKPPVAAWGAMNVYKASGDKAFLAEMFDKLSRFHRWWYTDRDHNHNGVCEYGSTDGTLIAAAWESGMDNGVRFDHTKMLKNGEHAWSMDQENICLNSFLYAEKKILAEMATILDKPEVAQQFTQEAEALKTFVQTKMFDPETGFFYDTHIDTGEHIKVMGAECWLPLWAGIATPEQARQVMEKMMDPNKFNSTLPLGTLDVSHPRLRPTRGYWRGPVWVDQVYFGIQGLRNYGFDREADQLLEKFIDNAQGLTTDGPIHENYNPLTGETLNCPNFGWSSACIIKMLLNN